MTDINKITPATVITGFLGAGKTTYLNSVLKHYTHKKFAVIENEFGEKSIDSDLIIRGEEDVIEINNGCLCCSLNEGLYDILSELYTKRDDFDELIIEATGVADPRGLCAPFINNPPIKKQFPLKNVLCLIDASLIEKQLLETEEAIHQITFSDILLINKTDLVDASYLNFLKQQLAKLNPLADIVVNDSALVQDIHQATPRFADQQSTILEQKSKRLDAVTVDHKHTKGIKSYSITFNQPFDLNSLRLRMHVFLQFQSKGLYRMKGILWLEGSDDKYFLQSVGSQLSIERLREWKDEEVRKSTIVIIGIGLERSSLEKMFNQCIASRV